eukprot:CAMPEP_0184738986 /NCGR_PEP_ID=MMETSP0315-20130426/1776_1 /TAXON_ID=101924 /ORGANISM="Rhodosorus marinus, Strain UTEX LB 2760" /LENGTH=356 /DNA_ID=CAMNT_0027207307 /DNA_START=162 /DNA_END=1232 /DNA_ORIENTATION=-
MAVLGWIQSIPGLRTGAKKRSCSHCSQHGTRLKCSIERLHVPVLLGEVLELYEGRRFEVFVDGTIGAGGHASTLLSSCDIDLYIGIDQDETALAIASERLSKYGAKVKLVQSNFRDLERVLSQFAIAQGEVDGILLDIGISSMQIDTADRGFSFMADGPLDMRMNRTNGLSVAEVVNSFGVEELARIFQEYGEDSQSRRMAKSVVAFRETKQISTTFELTEALLGAKWANGKRPRGYPLKIHPATRVFQALRIFVNRELEVLEDSLPSAIKLLRPGFGRLGVITFHSLEDRIVKIAFRESAKAIGGVKDLTRKPIVPTKEECASNPRSRSAKLRAVERMLEDEEPTGRKNKYKKES